MGKRGYHHGNLKQALVDSAIVLIKDRGPTGFTLSEAAKNAGVTPAAVYRHFDGREALIEEVASQGYIKFADRLEAEYADGKPNSMAAFGRLGRAYLQFARELPGHYIAMFESGVSVHKTPELYDRSQRAQRVLELAATQLCQNIPIEKRPPAQMFAAHVWALSHGVVELFDRNQATGPSAPIPADDLLESGIGVYLRGLGLIPQD